MDLNKEAEEYTKSTPDNDPIRILSFIAGHNSKSTQAKIIQAQIDVLNMSYVDQMLQLMRLEEQLRQLENER
jgi:hypothetical protein